MKAQKDLKHNRIKYVMVFFPLIGLYVGFMYMIYKYLPKENNYIAVLGILLATFPIFESQLNSIENESNKIKDNLINEDLKELHHIKDSINLFYIPLFDFLETDNINLLNTVIGHKYLAQPRVKFLFEEYLQTNKNKEKIIKLAHRDLEQLQDQLK